MAIRKLNDKDVLSLKELYNSGLSSWAIAKKFNTDYQISPRVARMIVYQAIEKLTGKQEFDGINPDDNFYYRNLNRMFMAKNGKLRASRNGQEKVKKKKVRK